MVASTDEKPAQDESEDTTAAGAESPTSAAEPRKTFTLAIRLSTLLTALAMAALLVVAIVFGWLYFSAQSTLSDRDESAAAQQRAEDIAAQYAVAASTIDYHDVNGWVGRLKHNTTPQLAAKFDATAPQLEQILLPLQWTSQATPLSADVISESGGIYKVNAYLNVTSTSAQNPDGGQTTVTYSLTIDSNSGWQITDVGGLQNALPTN